MIEGYCNLNNFRVSDTVKTFIQDIQNCLIDPDQQFYDVSWNKLEDRAKQTMGKVAAINTSETNHEKKGHEFDPILKSFALGSNGVIDSYDRQKDLNTPLIIRGVGGGSQKAYRQCWDTGRTFYAVDTGYFGNGKKKIWHRVTKNNLQNLGPIVERPDDRLKRIEWKFRKFTPGREILICPPSVKIMNLFGQPDPETWTEMVITELKNYTDRPVRVRLKPSRSERVSTKTIEADLDNNVHCLITYNSIAATEALLHGKPAIALGPNAAQVLCNNKLSEVEKLNIPSREEMNAFARHLSYCQFTVNELQNGTAWRIINEGS